MHKPKKYATHQWNYRASDNLKLPVRNDNSYFSRFEAISWNSGGNTKKSGALPADFAYEYGETNSREDWATIVENVLAGYTPGGRSAVYNQKVATGANITIDANKKSRVIRIGSSATVALAGLTITNGQVTGTSGGGIVNAGSLFVTNCTVSNNSALYGGGITNGGVLTVMNSTITNNSTANSGTGDKAGGGIYISSIGTATIVNSTISKNTAADYGGGINSGGVLTVTNCTITENRVRTKVSGVGGGVYIAGGTKGLTIIANSTISNNVVESTGIDSGGGGIGCGIGGGILSEVKIIDCIIMGNSAEYYGGGGIYNRGSNLTIDNSTISNNFADVGGGIIAYSGTTLNITNSTITQNRAVRSGGYGSGSGGGILASGVLTIANSEITENTAHTAGGIYNNSGVKMTLVNSMIAGNTAIGSAGGIRYGGTSNVINCVFSGNSSGENGGGIYVGIGTHTLTNCTFSGNSTPSFGGGIYISGTGVLTINNSIVAKNTAHDIYRGATTATISGHFNLIGNGTGQSSLVNGVNGNIVGTATAPIDPGFINMQGNDWSNWNLQLANDSPAITIEAGITDTPGIVPSVPVIAARPKVTVDKTKTTLTSVTLTLTLNKADYDRMTGSGIEYVIMDASTQLGYVNVGSFIVTANGKNYTAQVTLKLGFGTKNKPLVIKSQNAANDGTFKAVSLKASTAKYTEVKGLKLVRGSANLTSVALQFNETSLKAETDRIEIMVTSGSGYFADTITLIKLDDDTGAVWDVVPGYEGKLSVSDIFALIPTNPRKPDGAKAYTVTIDGLDPGTKYIFAVRSSIAGIGESLKAIKTSAPTLKFSALSAVKPITVPVGGSNSVNLQWKVNMKLDDYKDNNVTYFVRLGTGAIDTETPQEFMWVMLTSVTQPDAQGNVTGTFTVPVGFTFNAKTKYTLSFQAVTVVDGVNVYSQISKSSFWTK